MKFLLGIFPKKKINIFISYFFLGTLLALCFDPFNIPFLSLLIIGTFFILNEYVSKKFKNIFSNYFFCGILFGFGFFLTSMHWISNSVLQLDKNLYYIVPLILFFFPLLMSLFFGFMQLANAYLWSNSNAKIFYFSSIWIIFEFLRSTLFTGLPWNLIGYSWSWSLSYSQSVSFLGIYGLGLLTVFCSIGIFSLIIDKKNKIFFLISVVILFFLYLYGNNRITHSITNFTNNEVRIVHTAFDQDEKWLNESIMKTKSMGSNELITIFPESSFGFYSEMPENYVSGYIRNDGKKYFNSIKFRGYVYDKRILVPFGEFTPFSKYLFFIFPNNRLINNSLSKGAKHQEFPGNISPLICYEAIFPSYVRSNLSNETEILINISNDSWFGENSGPKQHFTHSRFRSIELGIPMVRSSNKGYSGLISPNGEIIELINTNEITFTDVKIPQRLETTFFREYGNFLAYFLIVLFFIIGYAINLKSIKIKHE